MFNRLLIANRGEVAVRIARTALDMGIETVVVHSEDDALSGHLHHSTIIHALHGRGPEAYLDIEQLVSVAEQLQCDAVHPGYGFLSENSTFARRCLDAGVTFVGPDPEIIDLFGNKLRARELAVSCGVPTNVGTWEAVSIGQAEEFMGTLGAGTAVMIKAVNGGGGKGMRLVDSLEGLGQAYERCKSEAQIACGSAELYVERYIPRARHIEVQIIGDGDQVSHLWDRECTLQRRQQKLVESAPSEGLSDSQREAILDYACKLARECAYSCLGTFEFLVDLDAEDCELVTFLEVNPRLQVEHTVTEEVLGLDLVQLQLELAGGKTLEELSLAQSQIPMPRGSALQLRINMEVMNDRGEPVATGGVIDSLTFPGGPGIRVDTFAYPGYRTVTSFDSLLAKLVVSSPVAGFAKLLPKVSRAIGEFDVDGVETNLSFIEKLLSHPAVMRGDISTRFVEEHITELLVDSSSGDTGELLSSTGHVAIRSPVQGVISDIRVSSGDLVTDGTELMLIEAMKLQHEVRSPCTGTVTDLLVEGGGKTTEGQILLRMEPVAVENPIEEVAHDLDLDTLREDLQEVAELRRSTLDDRRLQAVKYRRDRGQRTARENIEDLCDEGSFAEYGQLVVAYLHARKSDEELRAETPADGFIMGIATVHAEIFGAKAARVAVGSYDGSVMAGTQGHKNHQKTDRLFDLAGEHCMPLVLFAEGGGGRPREDPVTIAALENQTFRKLAELSGRVPLIGVVSGRCFAGNAALLGMVDVVIATENSNIGMSGPALIEAGGLGTFTPEEVGPIDVQHRNGVVDIRVDNEAEAVAAARKYLAYFQGKFDTWTAHDQRRLRHAIPEDRLRSYDVRDVIRLIADEDSVLELRTAYGRTYVTAFARVEGRSVGIIANNPAFNSGAIDADGADKAARFLRLCDAHGIPVVTLIDTPGIMVGPESEEAGMVRHSARMFVTAASLGIPIFAIVLRKAYGLGAMAAAGGHFKAPFFTIGWPSGELGGMGLEGGVQLAYKKELQAIDDPEERQAFFEERVQSRYRKGKASYIASYFELDAVIDPAESRRWIAQGLAATSDSLNSGTGRFIDTW